MTETIKSTVATGLRIKTREIFIAVVTGVADFERAVLSRLLWLGTGQRDLATWLQFICSLGHYSVTHCQATFDHRFPRIAKADDDFSNVDFGFLTLGANNVDICEIRPTLDRRAWDNNRFLPFFDQPK